MTIYRLLSTILVDNISVFKQGSTVPIETMVYTVAGVLTEPTSITMTVYEPDGTESVASSVMDEISTGVYNDFIALSSDATLGIWTAKITVTTIDITIDNLMFKVIEEY